MFYILDETGALVRTATSVPDTTGLTAAGYTVVESDLNAGIDNIEIRGFPRRTVVADRRPQVSPRIVLTTTADDTDGDGAPEIPADGESVGTVFVSLQDPKGSPLKKSVEVTFHVTAGAISQRTVVTRHGRATVQFTAGHETVTALVGATAKGFDPGYVRFELVPKAGRQNER